MKPIITKYFFITVLLTAILGMNSSDIQAQKNDRIQIRNAQRLIGSERGGVKYRKLIGDVILSQGNVLMYCDSAYDYTAQNFFQAFGRIRIRQGDSFLITGNKLLYDLKTRTAVIDQNVTMSDNKMQLRTTRLVYDLNTGTASFTSGAKITESNSTLTCKKGFYYARTKELHFVDNVELVNDQITMTCDSLRYNIATHQSIFISPTKIVSKDQTIFTSGGWYNTTNRTCEFTKKTRIISEARTIRGDTLYYDEANGYGRAKGNFELKDMREKMSISGNNAEYYDKTGRSYVTGLAMFTKYLESDTLYLHGDTIRMLKMPGNENTVVRVFNKVKAFSNDLQIKCDSLVYRTYDSSIYLYHDPVIWNKTNQITGLNIRITLLDRKIDKMFLEEEAIIISENDSLRFNQVKGRTMIGHFKNSELRSIDVTGNAEAIYFLKDDFGKYVGTNHIEASSIFIGISNSEINSINFLTSPTGNVQPPAIGSVNDIRLKGFVWRSKERPQCIEDIFKQP